LKYKFTILISWPERDVSVQLGVCHAIAAAGYTARATIAADAAA